MPSTYPGMVAIGKLLTSSSDRDAAQLLGGLLGDAQLPDELLTDRLGGLACDSCVSANEPLCRIALWNSPREPGEVMCTSTDRPPEDWPAMVTLRRSPPNLSMFCCTQRSAACWSIRP